ncbi:ankyrin repeat family A protein 2-like [Saccostrea echinata]|uniref:ankyrin repeat family A protein 2-like n=1 Tax=Saccostrea echinata TaxID=191078 RepID=UPI002A81704B|nr:ankyrin repeat family A protein 2-like [Saccostrea echinata]
MERVQETKPVKSKDDCQMASPERQRRGASSGKRQPVPPALRLMSPFDSDQELNDLEVASVLEGKQQGNDCLSPTKSKRHETPFRPTTVMTNLQRGNVQTTTPLFKNISLHQMAAQGELTHLHQEINEGCDVNKVDANDMTALLWACANGQQPAVEFLIKSGADINVSGSHGENALLLASCNGYLGIVEIFLKLGMDVNVTDETGNTALMYAAYRGHDSVVKLLLEYGADIMAQNEDNMNVMDMVVGQGNKLIQQVIERHMLSLFE